MIYTSEVFVQHIKEYCQFESAGQTIRFDTLTVTTDIRRFVVLCERADNTGYQITSAVKPCLEHLKRHTDWLNFNNAKLSVLFFYFNSLSGQAARLTPELALDGSILDVSWSSVSASFIDQLGLNNYVEASSEKAWGLFSKNYLD